MLHLGAHKSLKDDPSPGPVIQAHKGIIAAYEVAIAAYTEMNNDFSTLATWAQNLLPLANEQKQVTEERMEQAQLLFGILNSQTGTGDNLYPDNNPPGCTNLDGLKITDPYVRQLIIPNGSSCVPIDTIATVHTYYSSAASAITAAGNAADQTFSNTTQGAMGVVTNGTSSMSTLASMLQAFVQTISSSTVKL